MKTISRFALPLAAVVTTLLVAVPPASATPSCVAQSVDTEHQLYGTAWGSELIAFLAAHPEVLQEFGFRHLGELSQFAALQDRTACPPDL